MKEATKHRKLVKQAAQAVICAADELKGAIRENDVERIWVSNDRLRLRADTLKTELAVFQRLTPNQLI